MKYLTGVYIVLKFYFRILQLFIAIKNITSVIFLSRKRISSGYLFGLYFFYPLTLIYCCAMICVRNVSIDYFFLVSMRNSFFLPIIRPLTESIKRQLTDISI